jgi:hypothetical protein
MFPFDLYALKYLFFQGYSPTGDLVDEASELLPDPV